MDYQRNVEVSQKILVMQWGIPVTEDFSNITLARSWHGKGSGTTTGVQICQRHFRNCEAHLPKAVGRTLDRPIQSKSTTRHARSRVTSTRDLPEEKFDNPSYPVHLGFILVHRQNFTSKRPNEFVHSTNYIFLNSRQDEVIFKCNQNAMFSHI